VFCQTGEGVERGLRIVGRVEEGKVFYIEVEVEGPRRDGSLEVIDSPFGVSRRKKKLKLKR
jgi:hypothetical protein